MSSWSRSLFLCFVQSGVYALESSPDSGVGGDFYMLYAEPASALSGGVGCAHKGGCAQDYDASGTDAKPADDRKRTLKGFSMTNNAAAQPILGFCA